MKQPLTRHIVDLGQAASVQFPAGHTFRVVWASSATARVMVKLDDTSGDGLTLYNGEGWRHGRFDRLFISWSAQAGETLAFVVGGNPQAASPSDFDVYAATPADDGGERRADTMSELVNAGVNVTAIGTHALYTVPAGKEAVIRNVTMNHVASSNQLAQVAILDDTAATRHVVSAGGTVCTRIMQGVVLPAGWSLNLILDATAGTNFKCTAEVELRDA